MKIDFPFWIDVKKDDRAPRIFNFLKQRSKIGSFWRDERLDKLVCYCIGKGDARAFVFWESTDLIRKKDFCSSVGICFAESRQPLLFNLMTGEVTEVTYKKRGNDVYIPDLPVRDYPTAVVFGDFAAVK